MQNQLPLFLSYKQIRDLPIVQKYEKIFAELDLSSICEFNYGIGANGTSQHALVRAFVIRSLESLNMVSALIRDKNVLSLNITAVDSKPVKALTKHNNPKHPRQDQKNKNKKIKRNPKATLGYYSYAPTTDPETPKKYFSFFWGYRSHAIVDTESGLAIVEGTYPNNMPDDKIARKLYKKLKRLYKPKKGMIVIADKAYDCREFYTFIVEQIKAEPIICINPRNTQPDLKYSEKSIQKSCCQVSKWLSLQQSQI